MRDHNYYVLKPDKITQQTFIVTCAKWDYLAADVRKRSVDVFSGKDAKAKANKLAADLTTTRSLLHAITLRADDHGKVNAQKLADLLFGMDVVSKSLIDSNVALADQVTALESRITWLEDKNAKLETFKKNLLERLETLEAIHRKALAEHRVLPEDNPVPREISK